MRSTSSEKIKAHKTVTDSKPVTEKTEGVKIEKQEYTKSGIAIVVTEDGDDRIKQDSKGKPNSMMSDDGKNKETEKAVGKSDKKQDEAVKSAQLIDEIFKTTYILPQVEKTEIKRLENEETIYNVEKKKHDEETIYKVEKKKHDDQTHTARLLDKIFKRSSPRSASDEKIKSSEMQKTAHKTEIKDSDDKKSSSRLLDEIFKTTTPRSERYEDTKTQDTEKLAKKSDKTNHDQDHSARLMDEIFKTSAKLHKDVTQDMYVLGKDEEERKHSIEKRMGVSETKPPRPKERTHANTMTPRLDSAQTKEETMALGFGERGIKLQKEDSETKSSDKHSKHVQCKVAVAHLTHVVNGKLECCFCLCI